VQSSCCKFFPLPKREYRAKRISLPYLWISVPILLLILMTQTHAWFKYKCCLYSNLAIKVLWDELDFSFDFDFFANIMIDWMTVFGTTLYCKIAPLNLLWNVVFSVKKSKQLIKFTFSIYFTLCYKQVIFQSNKKLKWKLILLSYLAYITWTSYPKK